MSGIVGIVNLDGPPVDRRLLQRMTDFMAYRGPDAQVIWVDGQVGFGHAMLRTTFEPEREREPCSLDGQVWITADARVDDRTGLIRELEGRRRGDLKAATDAELILHAYHVWGEGCTKHLLGDFAFAIWDGRTQRLFCARDPFGVKLFYYAYVAGCFIFSNTLSCLRLHPVISDQLNELAIADFLLFYFNPDLSTTTFADIQRLSPAHYLSFSQGALRTERYWSLPIDGEIIRYKRASDYVDHFKELLAKAVGDRLRTDRVAVWMSGGLDSTTLAATASQLRSKESMDLDIQAHCTVYDRLIPDEERYYSGLVGKALEIPIHYHALDDYKLFERWDEPELHRPEPIEEPLLAQYADLLKETAAYSRVVLNGEDPDALLCPSTVTDMLRGIGFWRVMGDVSHYVLSYCRRPPLGLGIYTQLNRWLGRARPLPYPKWLNPEFEARFDLRDRSKEGMNGRPDPIHPIRPQAHRRLTQPIWQYVLEFLDPGVNRYPVEFRFPYLDLRLVSYLLAIPSLPWCVNKELLRAAMRSILPEPVRLRPKTPLAAYAYYELLRQPGAEWLDDFLPTPELAKYVNRQLIPPVARKVADADESWLNLRPLSLDYWLRYHREEVS